MAHTVDRILLVLALALPIWCVVRWNFRGALFGAFLFWVILMLAGSVLSQVDPERGASVVDGVWLLFGWLAGLLYALALYGLKRLYLFLRTKYERKPEANNCVCPEDKESRKAKRVISGTAARKPTRESRKASEYERLHELTRHLQILDEVYEAFGDPDQSRYCGIIDDRSRSERLAELQHWRDEQAKRRSKFFARLIRRFVGDRTPAPPEWETVRDGPKWIYTRLSEMADVHVGIDPAGRVAIKLFDKGESDGA